MTDAAPALPQPVLVTGGAGFIGRHLTGALLARGNDVLVFDLPGATLPAEWLGRVRFVPGDIADPADVRRAMHKVGTVFHTAAVVSDWAPRAEYRRVTLEGSRHLFQEAVRNQSRVLLLSSFAVYGDRIGRGLIREEDGFGRPLGLYSEFKQRQEELAWSFHRQHQMPLSVVRPSKVYGPGSRPWVHEVAKVLLAGRPALVDGGKYNPGLVYVDNLVDILILAASLPAARGRAYNGYDGTQTTLRQYFTDLAAIMGAPPPKTMPLWLATGLAGVNEPLWKILGRKNRPLLTRDSLRFVSSDYQISTDRVRIDLGYTPRVSYEEGIQRVADYWHSIKSKEYRNG